METSLSSYQKPNKFVLQPIKACETFEHFQLGKANGHFWTSKYVESLREHTLEIWKNVWIWSRHGALNWVFSSTLKKSPIRKFLVEKLALRLVFRPWSPFPANLEPSKLHNLLLLLDVTPRIVFMETEQA